jgi:hypothetical protein
MLGSPQFEVEAPPAFNWSWDLASKLQLLLETPALKAKVTPQKGLSKVMALTSSMKSSGSLARLYRPATVGVTT